MSIERLGPRAVLVLGVLAGVGQAVTFARLQPDQVTLATDVYYHAAEAALDGGDPYSVTPPDLPTYYFLYPPVVLGVMLPYGLFDPVTVYVLQTGANLLTTAAIALLLVRTVKWGGVDLGRLDTALIVAFAFGSTGAVTNLLNGQVNPQLALGIAGGVLLVERGRGALGGVVLAAVATVKLFPTVVGAWLLRRRAWRAVGAAVATGCGLMVLGLVAFGPDLTTAWVTDALARESSVGTFEGGPNPGSNKVTVRRQIAALAPGVPGEWLLPVGAVVLTPVVLAASRVVETLLDRLIALQATLLAMLILVPLEPFYVSLAVFPAVPLLYLMRGRWPRRLYVVGFLLAAVPVTMSSLTVWIDTLSLSPGAADAVTSVAGDAFAFALPPMYGVWLMFGACLLFQHRRVEGRLDGGSRDQ